MSANLQEIHDAVGSLQRLTDLFRERRRELATSAGLSEPQWALLEEVATEHFMPSLFARRSDRSPAAVSKILRQLLDKGLLVVSLSELDGRQRRYELSSVGSQTLIRLRAERQRAMDQIWQLFDRADILQFTHFSTELSARLAEYSQEQSAG